MKETLRDELKAGGGFHSLEQEALLNLARTNDHIQIQFVRLFREFGITPAQYNILRVLRGAKEPLPILEVASRLITMVPGITGLIDRLETLALVQRKRCPSDRRVIYVEITAMGREMLAKLDRPVQDLEKAVLGHLTQKELKEMISLLEKSRMGD